MDIDDRAKIDSRFEVLASELAELRAENQRLAAEVVALSPHRPEATPAPMQEGLGHSPLSRRNALRALGGAAVAGAGLMATGALGAQPAAATDPNDLALGSTSNTAGGPTGLAVTGNSSSYGIGVTDNGLDTYPSGLPTGALFGHCNNKNFLAGVAGFDESGVRTGVYGSGAPGVEGVSTNGQAGVQATSVGGTGYGLIADGYGGIQAQGSGAPGMNASGSPGVL